MRIAVMLLFLFIAATCYAEDPLESLNTVQDAVSTMEQTLKTRAAEHAMVSAAVVKGPESCSLANRKPISSSRKPSEKAAVSESGPAPTPPPQ